MRDIAIAAKNLHYSYNEKKGVKPYSKTAKRTESREALCGINFEAKAHKITGILGPNGSGKSTAFKILSTQLALQQGDAQVLGFSLREEPNEIRKVLGVTFQAPSLDPLLSIRENLELHGALYGLNGTRARARVNEVLELLGLSARATERVKTLSGGLARRVELAKTLISKPRLLLLDEPTTGLDPLARDLFWKELKRLVQAEGLTILFTTHSMEEAELCDELLFFSEGQVVADGEPERLRAEFGADVVTFEGANLEGHLGELKQALTKISHSAASSAVDIEVQAPRLVRIRTQQPFDVLEQVKQVYKNNLSSLHWSRATLGDVYFKKTGRSLEVFS